MEFRILGPLEVLDDAGTSVALRGTRERMLLALLLLSANRVVPADQLTDGLWGDYPPDGSAHALQVHVSRLRKGLREAAGDELVVTRPPGYLLQVNPTTVDAVRFETLVAEARAEAGRGENRRAAATLREALGLWRGPALADVAEAPGVRGEAVRLEEARLSALEERVEADLACARHGDLVAELDALTFAHPWRERLWAQRMMALYRTGRQADALRAYQDLRKGLVDGLGLEPSNTLQQLEGAILRREPALELRAAPAVGAAESGPAFDRTPFVGRSAERTTLSTALTRGVDGSGSLVLIGGEPGIGKTRLAEEAAAEAAGRGFRVLSGHCYEREGASPYVAFVDILEMALTQAESPDAFLADTLGDAAPEVARLLPRLRRLLPALPAPLDLPPEQERRYLFTCLSEVLARLAGARPTLVMLDDLQWADEPTLLFLEHLAPHLSQLPLVVVATYRDAEVSPALARTFAVLHPRRLAQRVVLQGMASSETAEVVRALVGQEPPPALVEGLHAETEGNPFFLEEVVRDLMEDGRAFHDDGQFRDDIDVAALAVPEGVRLVIGRRLERLSDDARRLLVAAAVAGRTFTFRLLQRLTDLPDSVVLDVIDDAVRAMLVRELPAEGAFLFAHEIVRQTLVSGLSGPRRCRAHLRAAQAMIDVQSGGAEELVAEIAHHLVEARDEADPQDLLAYSIGAGRRALTTSAHKEALSHLERAVRLEAVAGPAQRADLYSALGSTLGRLGRWNEALAAWERSLAEFEALGDDAAVGQTCLEVGLNLGWANRIPEAFAMYQRGLGALGERVNPTRARLLARMASMASVGADPATGDAMYDEALRVSDAVGDEPLRGFVLGEMACGRYISMRPADAVAAGTEGFEILRAGGDLWGAATALGFVEISLVHCGRFTQATQVGADLRPMAERVGNYPALFLDVRARGIQDYWNTGDLEALEAFAQQDMEFSERYFPAFAGHAYSRVGMAAFLRGDWPTAERWLERGAANPPAIVPGFCWGTWFQYLAFAGRREEALAFFAGKRVELPTPARPNRWTAWTLLMAFTEGLFVLGEREEPAEWYPLILEARTTGAVATDNYGGRLVERVAGIAATAAGNWVAAEEHFGLALHQADLLPHQLERLETRRFYAQMLIEQSAPGDQERARTLLQEAAEGFTRLGMPRHAQLARDALVSG